MARLDLDAELAALDAMDGYCQNKIHPICQSGYLIRHGESEPYLFIV